jgi:hypothetical protein
VQAKLREGEGRGGGDNLTAAGRGWRRGRERRGGGDDEGASPRTGVSGDEGARSQRRGNIDGGEEFEREAERVNEEETAHARSV